MKIYFIKTAKIPVYGHVAVYGNIAPSVLIDYTLICLEYILLSIFTIKTPWALAAPEPLGLFIVKALTNVP